MLWTWRLHSDENMILVFYCNDYNIADLTIEYDLVHLVFSVFIILSCMFIYQYSELCTRSLSNSSDQGSLLNDFVYNF